LAASPPLQATRCFVMFCVVCSVCRGEICGVRSCNYCWMLVPALQLWIARDVPQPKHVTQRQRWAVGGKSKA
jgi:hypothetical protein